MERACENCGTPDDELAMVRRVYMEPGQPGVVQRMEDETELWCLSCTSLYPHQVAET